MTKGLGKSILFSLIAAGMMYAAAPVMAEAPVRAETPKATNADATAMLRQLDEAYVHLAEVVTPAVVNISSSKKEAASMGGELEPFFKNHPFKDFFGDEFFKRFKNHPNKGHEDGGSRVQGMGSGVIISPDGYILTNSHVVKEADEIKVNLSDRRSFTAKVVGADPESDIAVVKIDATNLPIARMGDSSKMRAGENVLAVGNPFGLNRTVTRGIISAIGRTNMGIIDYEDFIQTDAAINPGNSGGPLVNMSGEVIGINTAIASRSGGYQGIGFAIPSNSAKLIMDELIKTGKVRRGLLGVNIQDVTEALAKSFKRPDSYGALVSQVVEGSPAEKAGVQSGDIITKFNGHDVTGAAQLKNMVGQEKPGASSTLTLWRNNKTMEVNVTIGERDQKSAAAKTTPSTAGDTSNELGVEIEKVPAQVAEQMGLKDDQGVRIKDVASNSAAAKMGLRPGDVILQVDDQPIKDVAGFNSAVKEAKNNKVIRLQYQRGTSKLFTAMPLN